MPSKLPKSKPKLNPNYKTEESEVQSALSRNKNDFDLDAKVIDRQISFFVNTIASNQFDEVVPENGSEHSLRTNDNVMQLASSFVQVDDENPVDKWKKEKIFFDDNDLLYYPQCGSVAGINTERVVLRDDGYLHQ